MTGDELHTILRDRGIKQKELGALLGVSPENVSRWRKGDHPIPVGTALLLRLIQGGHVSLEMVTWLRTNYES
jgi:transcriptional regulator with XRE-family HTH domain